MDARQFNFRQHFYLERDFAYIAKILGKRKKH